MPNLSELQTMMSNALRQRGQGAVAHLLPLLPWLTPGGVNPAAAIEVSRNNFSATLVSALRTSFPAVSRLVGKRFFNDAAAAFVSATPPRSAWLDSYGAAFPSFLSRMTTLSTLPYIAEVAELEWLVNRALHAPGPARGDTGMLDIEALAALDDDVADRVRLHAAPSLGLLRTIYPADAIWSAVLGLDSGSDSDNSGDSHTIQGEARMSAIDLQSGPVWLCVSRQDHGVVVRRMTQQAWRVAAALRDGDPLATALSDVDGDPGTMLAMHAHNGYFTGFSIGALPLSHGVSHSHAS